MKHRRNKKTPYFVIVEVHSLKCTQICNKDFDSFTISRLRIYVYTHVFQLRTTVEKSASAWKNKAKDCQNIEKKKEKKMHGFITWTKLFSRFITNIWLAAEFNATDGKTSIFWYYDDLLKWNFKCKFSNLFESRFVMIENHSNIYEVNSIEYIVICTYTINWFLFCATNI